MEDYWHPDLLYSATDKPMQLDIYIPSLSLALEYQGHQHYGDAFYMGTSVRMYQHRDEEKRKACKKANLTLVEVPYWWDNSKESLAATIQLSRPELIPDQVHALPIPSTPPSKLGVGSKRAKAVLTSSTETKKDSPQKAV
jgi:hypothetical protein